MRIGLALCSLTAAVWLILVSAAKAEPLRIGYLTWVGLGPLFVAKEKGLFAKEGVEVELINMAIHEAMYAGLAAGQIDASDATVDDMLPNYDPEQPYACVFAPLSHSAPMASSPATTSARSPISRARRWRSPRARCRSSI